MSTGRLLGIIAGIVSVELLLRLLGVTSPWKDILLLLQQAQ